MSIDRMEVASLGEGRGWLATVEQTRWLAGWPRMRGFAEECATEDEACVKVRVMMGRLRSFSDDEFMKGALR